MKYIVGSFPCLAQSLSPTSAGTSTDSSVNTDYTLWKRQDQLLFHSILAFTTERVAPLIANCTISKEAWEKLAQLYSSKSRSRIITFRERLTEPRRENQYVATYLNSLKSTADGLKLIGSPVTDYDLVEHYVNGIEKEFREITGEVMMTSLCTLLMV